MVTSTDSNLDEKKKLIPLKILTGGQTGVDRAAMDAAIEADLQHGGWCPRGRIAEDGVIGAQYLLSETPVEQYSQRSEWNVRDSDGHLVLAWGGPQNGTLYALRFALSSHKPTYIVDMEKRRPDEVDQIYFWIVQHSIRALNISGPRESFRPGTIYKEAREFCEKLFRRINL